MLNIFAKWYRELNHWEWPKDWGKPPDWAREKYNCKPRDRYEHCKERYHKIMGLLMLLAGGDKEVSRYHNVSMGKMNDEEFETWWEDGIKVGAGDMTQEDYFEKHYAIS